MSTDAATLWNVLSVVVLPVVVGAFWLLWNRIATVASELWQAHDTFRRDLTLFQVEAERRFIKAQDLELLRNDLLRHLERIEQVVKDAMVQRDRDPKDYLP